MTNLRFLAVALPPLFFMISAGTWAAASPQPRGKPFPSGRLQLGVQVLSQKYCAYGSEGLPTLRFKLSFQFKNLTGGQLTFNHVAVGDAVYIGKSVRNIHAGKYEPGSRLPDTVGISPSKKWQPDGRAVAPGGTLEIRTTNIWISLATNKKQRELGASPGRHFLRVFGEAEISDKSHGPATVILSSVPAPFVVDPNPKVQSCD
jgi:hypothetical protein